MALFLHVNESNERWLYTLKFIFNLRGIDFHLSDSKTEFDAYFGAKFSFDDWTLSELLHESGVTNLPIDLGFWEGIECLSFGGKCDPLASIFYVLTRMEEYNSEQKDAHNRFSAKSSLQAKFSWLEKCICDRWALKIIEKIESEIKTSLHLTTQNGAIVPTFDIDNAFAFLLKKGKRKWLSDGKDIVTLNFRRFFERRRVLAKRKKDPYDTYEFIFQIAENFPIHLFWLVGDYGKYDMNITLESQALQNLVKRLETKVTIGIHPSYLSNERSDLICKERMQLENVVERPVSISRQHFLKLEFPKTYTQLLASNITEDFTMGFASEVGFRNGTAHPFPWFNLEKNQITKLIIRPFAYMDGTLNEYLSLSPDQANEKIKKLYEEVEHCGGDFVFIWHNETIGNYGNWKNWKSVLDFTLNLRQPIHKEGSVEGNIERKISKRIK